MKGNILSEDDIQLPSGFEHTIHNNMDKNLEENKNQKQKKRKCSTALYVDKKRKKLEKNLSGKQRDTAMLQLMKEDVSIKKRYMSVEKSSKNADSSALMKIADSMQMLSKAIIMGCQSGQNLLNIINRFGT